MSLFDDYTLPIDRNRPAGVLPPPRNQKDARCYHDIAAWLDAQASLMSNGGQPTTNLLITFRRLVWASALQATARDIAAISRDPKQNEYQNRLIQRSDQRNKLEDVLEKG